MSDVQKVLDRLTAADAAIAAGRYALQGEYRIAATLLQLAGALQVREPQPFPAPLPAALASIHAPTTCVATDVSGALCGELIRFTEINGWYHVNDRRLGASTHSATPQVPGPLPARPR